MKLMKKNIEKSISHGEEKGFFDKLNKLYDGIDSGNCSGCTNCCMESVNTFYIAFLNIYRYLRNRKNLFKELMPRVIKYYFLELVEKSHCPFLEADGKCSIYEVRPLTCRLFGHANRKEHEENYTAVLEENRESKKYFKKTFGLEIPQEIVEYKIEYCNDFEVGKRVRKHQRQSMIDSIFMMESSFFMNELISENFIGTGLVSWFAYTCFNLEEAGELRLKIMREYAETGGSQILKEILRSYNKSSEF